MGSMPAEPPLSLSLLLPAALMLGLRAVLVAGEAAVAAVGAERATELAGEARGGRSLERLKQDPERSAAGVRATLGLALSAGAALTAFVAADTLPGDRMWAALAGAAAAWLLALLADTTLRALALTHPEWWALATAPLQLFLRGMFSIPTRLVAATGDLLLRPLGTRIRFAAAPPPLEEIQRILTDTKEEGAPEPALVRSLFDFGERTVKEIMVPRTDVFAIALDASPDEVVRLFLEEGHTRVPVYRESLDRIVGLVHVKDLLPLIANPELIILHDLVRPTTFVPWNRPVQQVMRELQKAGQHLAVVVDEYGGVAGIVTLEDIVEQLVGDIRDEFDEEAEVEVTASADGASLVRADMRVGDFNEQFDADVPEEEGYETLAGFLNALAGAIPSEGDRFYHGGFEFQVVRRDPRRVVEVRVTRTRAESSSAGPST